MPAGDVARMHGVYDTFGCDHCLISWLQIYAIPSAATRSRRRRWRGTGSGGGLRLDRPERARCGGRRRALAPRAGDVGQAIIRACALPMMTRATAPGGVCQRAPPLRAARAGRFRPQVARSRAYPQVSFLLAHSADSWAAARASADMARGRANVFLEDHLHAGSAPAPSNTWCGSGRRPRDLRHHCADARPAAGLAGCATRLSEAEKRLILGENMRRSWSGCDISAQAHGVVATPRGQMMFTSVSSSTPKRSRETWISWASACTAAGGAAVVDEDQGVPRVNTGVALPLPATLLDQPPGRQLHPLAVG